MKRSTDMVCSMLSLACMLLVFLPTMVKAEDPAKKPASVKPQWQRYLQGEHAKQAAKQEKRLAKLAEAGKFEDALKVAEALAELRGKVQGVDHWEAVSAHSDVEAIRLVLRQGDKTRKDYVGSFGLQIQGETLMKKGLYKEAQPFLEQLLTIQRKVLGEEHSDTAVSYDDLASSLFYQSKYQEAEKGYRKALAIFRKMLGEEHPLTARCYNNLALNLKAQSKYRDSEVSLRKALAIRRKVLGEEDSSLALSYDNLANILQAQGKYKEAEEGHRRALVMYRKLMGEEHLDTAICYVNLAQNLYYQGKYQEAEEGRRKALAVFRKVVGEEHPYIAISYNDLAVILDAQGRSGEAEEGLRKTLAIRRKVLGEEHAATATSYNNLASNLAAQGKYTMAEEFCRKALAIDSKVFGEEHVDTARSYSNLASSLGAQGKLQEAEKDHRKALAIRRKVLGEEHPDTANSYNNLALNQAAQGRYGESEEGFREALAIHRNVLSDEHPDTANSYNNLALNQNLQGRYGEAEQGFRKTLAVWRKILGEEHPLTATSYNNLAFNQHAQGKYKEAEEIWRLAADSFAKARLHLAASGLERAAKTSEQSPLPFLAAVLARNGKPEDAWQRFEESLARGTWDDLSARLLRTPDEQAKQAQLTAQLDQLEKFIEKAVSIKNPTSEQNKDREKLLTKQRQTQEGLYAFSQQLEKKYGPVAGQVFDRSQIQTALPPDAALLGWLDIPGQPKAADPNGEHWAILLRSSGTPVWVRLSGSGDKDAWTDADTQLPARLREALQSSRGLWEPLAERLRQQRLQPLTKHLEGVRHLIVLPSTALAGVPLEVIADGYTVSYAHSGTMYAHLRQQTLPKTEGLFALADPVFETPTAKQNPQPLPPGGVLLTVVIPDSNAAKAGLRPNDVLLRYGNTDLAGPADFKPQPESPDPNKRVPLIVWRDGKTLKKPLDVRPGKLGVVFAQEPAPQALAEQRRLDRLLVSRGGDEGKWDRLPGTRVEVASLQRLFGNEPSRVLLDSDASEQRLDDLAKTGALGKYRYIHLATHGEVNDLFPLRSAVILSRDQLPDDKQRTDLLVSGQPIPDGRLTAEEVLRGWNLHCDLVTLSACQTALGKYERGEGFVGFAQALVLAGSRSVCLSLWKVDDTATALLMERFYQNLLGKRAGLDKPLRKAAALAEAKAWLRELSREEAVKRAASLSQGVDRGPRRDLPPLEVTPASTPAKTTGPFAHPYYWAAFVLVGHAD